MVLFQIWQRRRIITSFDLLWDINICNMLLFSSFKLHVVLLNSVNLINSGKKYGRSLSSCPEPIALDYSLWREERCNWCLAEHGKIKLKVNFIKP
jgi:hypothetical protein